VVREAAGRPSQHEPEPLQLVLKVICYSLLLRFPLGHKLHIPILPACALE
jgi:hypothetical protein